MAKDVLFEKAKKDETYTYGIPPAKEKAMFEHARNKPAEQIKLQLSGCTKPLKLAYQNRFNNPEENGNFAVIDVEQDLGELVIGRGVEFNIYPILI